MNKARRSTLSILFRNMKIPNRITVGKKAKYNDSEDREESKRNFLLLAQVFKNIARADLSCVALEVHIIWWEYPLKTKK